MFLLTVKNHLKLYLFTIVCCLSSFSAHAVLVSTSLQGVVTLDNGGANPFGLVNGNTVSATALYDDSLVVGADPDEQIFIDNITMTAWDFSFTLGSFHFSKSDVTDASYTSFYFDNGRLDGISFFIDPIDIGLYTGLLIEDFAGGTSLFVEDSSTHNPIYLELDWDFINASPPVVVPLPGVFWLFFSGLTILFGLQKRYLISTS